MDAKLGDSLTPSGGGRSTAFAQCEETGHGAAGVARRRPGGTAGHRVQAGAARGPESGESS